MKTCNIEYCFTYKIDYVIHHMNLRINQNIQINFIVFIFAIFFFLNYKLKNNFNIFILLVNILHEDFLSVICRISLNNSFLFLLKSKTKL